MTKRLLLCAPCALVKMLKLVWSFPKSIDSIGSLDSQVTGNGRMDSPWYIITATSILVLNAPASFPVRFATTSLLNPYVQVQ